MTIRSLINFGQSLKFVGGINIKILDTDVYRISYCVLNKKDNIVDIVDYGSEITDISDLERRLKEVLPNESRVHINVEGRGILTKVSEGDRESLNRADTIRKLFPIIKIEEFTIQSYSIGSSIFFHALRNDLIEKFKTLTSCYSVVSLSIGPFITAPLSSIIHKEVLDLEDYKVNFQNGRISKLELSQSLGSDVLIGATMLPSKAILAYASAWNVIVANTDIKISGLLWIEDAVKRAHFNKTLYYSARAGLIMVLAILFVNTFVNFWLQSQTQNLTLQETLYSGQKNESDVRYKKLSTLATAYENIGWASNKIPVYYADQIGQKVSSEIQLTLLEIGVINSEVLRKEKKYIFQNNVIKVKGFSQTPVSLKQWVDLLESLDWIKSISNQRYQYDSKQGKGLFEFYVYVR